MKEDETSVAPAQREANILIELLRDLEVPSRKMSLEFNRDILHPVHQCAQSRAHLGRRQVYAVTMSGKDPLESVLTKPPK